MPVVTGGTASSMPAAPKKIKAKAPPIDVADTPAAPEIRIKSEEYYDVKTQVFSALIDTIDLSQLSKLDNEGAREEIRDIVNDIIAIKSTNDIIAVRGSEDIVQSVPGKIKRISQPHSTSRMMYSTEANASSASGL